MVRIHEGKKYIKNFRYFKSCTISFIYRIATKFNLFSGYIVEKRCKFIHMIYDNFNRLVKYLLNK